MSDPRPILIAAGGTGGHVYPALAIAEALRERGVPVVWLGTRNGIEARSVPAAGFPIEWVSVAGLRGKSLLPTLLAPLRLARACLQTWQIIRRHRPAGVLGMGGFVAAPGSLLAVLKRLPLFIHEQNSVAGLTNRMFSRFARQIFTAFPHVLSSRDQVSLIGNPVRREIEGLENPVERMQSRQGSARVLIVGGSLGARILNQTLPDALSLLRESDGSNIKVEVWHQCGRAEFETTADHYSRSGITMESTDISARVEPFIDDMAAAYEWADLLICRSGAMTVSELAAAGVASVLIPYPHAVDDHQTGNARWLSDAGASVLLPQSDLDAQGLAKLLLEMLSDRQRLTDMSVRARKLHRQGAADYVADRLCEVAI